MYKCLREAGRELRGCNSSPLLIIRRRQREGGNLSRAKPIFPGSKFFKEVRWGGREAKIASVGFVVKCWREGGRVTGQQPRTLK
jgi:hypothetical protein